ncbi:beta-propeller fold lactonase family protein [Granulicella sp. WH15]|uniref:lactonase family protein n=1 Tax=Granulicella sp. WH15 TaxID=2602070 RepID=UPI001367522A|nr:beta-propeller fold lactonase family protein [Granulicella sp. WH15]QHN03228.1 beta-propeller fold lactonase family protein [Granulicella sp. WH15]
MDTMTKQPSQWTRRTFSTGLAIFAGIPSLSLKALAKSLNDDQKDAAGFAYIGSEAGEGAIHVFDTTGDHWRPMQRVPAMRPAHLERHPSLPILYAVHAVDLWDHLPRGAVSAYSINASSGRLQLLNTRALSLSATSPRHAVVTDNGAHLIVAAQKGGSYDLLPIASDGSLMASESVRKEVGLVEGLITKTAQPRCILRHPDGSTLLTADSGNEAMHSFKIEAGLLQRQASLRIHPQAGPSQIDHSSDGKWIYALNSINGSLSVHAWNQVSKQISAASQVIALPRPGATLMAMHPERRFLVTAGVDDRALAIHSLSIDHRTGRLALVESTQQRERLSALAFSPNGEYLVGVGADSGQIIRLSFDSQTGVIRNRQSIAQVDSASCVAFHSA